MPAVYMSKKYRFFRYITVSVSVAFAMTSIWYWVNALGKQMLSIQLQSVVNSLDLKLRKANGDVEKERLATAYSPYFFQLSSELQDSPGYWKAIYKMYHNLGRAAIYQGRPADAVTYLNESLRYHPYYSNAYHMLSKVWFLLRQDEYGRACEDVYRKIMTAKRPSNSMMHVCRGHKW